MTVYERLKMELSNQQYLSEEQYNQLLAENDLVPSDNYVKSEMQKSLLFTVLDVLEAVANDIDVMSDISTEFTDIGQAYAFIEDRINNVKNKIAAIPDEDEEYSNFSLMYTNGQGMPRNTSGDNGNVDGISEEELKEKLEDYATKEYVDEVAENFVAGKVDLTNYATKEYVDGALENVNPNVDLTDYATKQYVDNGLNNKSNKNHTHNQYLTEHQSLAGYATENYVSTAIANAQLGGGEGGVDLSGYVTDNELSSALANKANKNHTHSEYITSSDLPDFDNFALEKELNNYATKTEVNNAIANIETGNSDNDSSVELTMAEYNALSTAEKNNGKTYFVTDDNNGTSNSNNAVGNGYDYRYHSYLEDGILTNETFNGKPVYLKMLKIPAYQSAGTTDNVKHWFYEDIEYVWAPLGVKYKVEQWRENNNTSSDSDDMNYLNTHRGQLVNKIIWSEETGIYVCPYKILDYHYYWGNENYARGDHNIGMNILDNCIRLEQSPTVEKLANIIGDKYLDHLRYIDVQPGYVKVSRGLKEINATATVFIKYIKQDDVIEEISRAKNYQYYTGNRGNYELINWSKKYKAEYGGTLMLLDPNSAKGYITRPDLNSEV